MSEDDETGLAGLVGSTLGEYQIERGIGAGGMGAVFVGRHARTGWQRAIKVIRPEMAAVEGFRERFLEEARILGTLDHPNVLRVYELAAAGPHLYLVTELLEGETIGSRLRGAPGTLPIAEVTRWFAEALAGVAEAHRSKVWHRDIKPDNLFLCAQGGVKVLDFGIAKAASQATSLATTLGKIAGTPHYMAPELAHGAPAGPASDVYAMGIALYECLVGRHPFGASMRDAAEPILAMMFAHTNTPMPDPRQARPDIPQALARVVLTAAAKSPDDRYPDAEAMRRALTHDAGQRSDGYVQTRAAGLSVTAPTLSASATPVGPRPDRVTTPATERPLLGLRGWIALAGLAIVAVGALAAWRYREVPSPSEPIRAAPAPAPAEPVRPAPVDPRTPLNRWIRVPAPAGPIALGAPAADVDDAIGAQGLASGVDVFAGPAYEIQEHEVTWEEYGLWSDPGKVVPDSSALPPEPHRLRLPVTGVAYRSAERYCQSLAGGSDLPSEAEWEFAARGAALRPNPWGIDPVSLDRIRAYGVSGCVPAPVKSHPLDRTPEGVFDLAGNAVEWTRSPFRLRNGTLTDRHDVRAGRGLPMCGAPPSLHRLPARSLTVRWFLCDQADCGAEDRTTRAQVGFRCVRHPGAAVSPP